MKRIAFIVSILLLQPNIWALGGYSTLSGDEKSITDGIADSLDIDKEDAYTIFNDYLKGYFNAKHWEYTIFDNETLSSSKVKTNKNNRICHLNIATDDRFVNVSLSKYAKEKQILVHEVETLPRNSNIVIEKYNNVKQNTNFELKSENNSFATFGKKGMASRVRTLVYSGVGGIQFMDMSVYDLKK